MLPGASAITASITFQKVIKLSGEAPARISQRISYAGMPNHWESLSSKHLLNIFSPGIPKRQGCRYLCFRLTVDSQVSADGVRITRCCNAYSPCRPSDKIRSSLSVLYNLLASVGDKIPRALSIQRAGVL